MAGNVKDLTDATFQNGVESGVTLVDFWAPWCPPCRAQGPIVEKLADAFAGKAAVAKVNVDENGGVAGRFGVMNIPTILVFKDGEEARRFVGLRQQEELSGALNELLR
ncbi:MAG: thioredoxin [Planctomycetota bacterium]|jgi:thioredoxin 1|nr:thioredoxin [Planctomycetota bacterium]